MPWALAFVALASLAVWTPHWPRLETLGAREVCIGAPGTSQRNER